MGIESKIAKLDQKIDSKFLSQTRRYEQDLQRGAKKFIREFAGTKFLYKYLAQYKTKSEEETMNFVNRLGLVEKYEDPKEVIKELCENNIPYKGADLFLFPHDFFHYKK